MWYFRKKIVALATSLLIVSAVCTANFRSVEIIKALPGDMEINYAPDVWIDNSPGSRWEIDEALKVFEFNKNNEFEYNFTSNTMVTNQFDIREATVTMEAKFKGTTTSAYIANDPDSREVQFGLIPWYIDSNNWLMVYTGFKKVSNGHLFDVNCYAKINGSTHVEYFVREEGNRWIPPSDPDNIEWHSCWPDGINGNKNPSTLEETEVDPSEENSIYVRKTRKTFAGKTCDSIFVKVNDYELNFGRDNFMFSDPAKIEEANPDLMPAVGLYVMNMGKTIVSNLRVNISYDKVLPLPTIEPTSTPVTTGTVDSKVRIPDFIAYDNNGENLDYEIGIIDPFGDVVYLDGENYFVPKLVGKYIVTISATDAENNTGKYVYEINVKSGKGHIDEDVYDDYLTPIIVDTSIIIAKAIFIAIPVTIALYTGLKILLVILKKRRESK
ncbi:MAG: hypothetical protein BWX74_00304 [Tenericutes bacterium ADurb.Bin087]|nr:MAG: hypothetical protein BWX74_00304 [Tenericutes bacterium ADurb.Bin087]